MSYSSGDEDYDCPLCMEEFDLEDRNFRPCPCGYQICRFCWHHIREDLNGRCPACRRIYSEETVEFTPVTPDQRARIKREKKEKERQAKEIEAMNRKHLANMRVVQKNLVYIIGLNPRYANEETLRQSEYFGQYGKIAKIVVNKRNPPPTTNPGAPPSQPSVGVYITFHRKEDAAKAIAAVDGSVLDGRILRASYGTTKYCTYYLRNMACQNPGCMYLHEPGEDADSYTKEDLAIGKHHLSGHGPSTSETGQKASVLGNGNIRSGSTSSGSHRKVVESGSLGKSLVSKPDSRQSVTTSVSSSSNNACDEDDRPALPPTASWASWATKPSSNPSTPTIKNTTLPERAATPESFGPPLAVAVAIGNQKKHPQTSKRKHEQHGKGSTESVSLIEKKEDVEVPILQMSIQTDATTNKAQKEIEKVPPAPIDLPTTPAITTTDITTTSVSSTIPSAPVPKRPLKPHRNDSEGLVQYVLGTVVNEADIPSLDPTTSSDTVSEVGSEDTLPTSFSSSSSGNLPPPNDFAGSLSNISSLVSALPTANNYMGFFNPFNENNSGSSATAISTPAQEYLPSFDPFQESIQSPPAGPPMPGSRSRATSRFGFAQDFLSRQIPSQGFSHGHGHLPTYTAQHPNQGIGGLITSGAAYLQRDLDPKITNDGLRALLPNANINFSGDTPRTRSQQWNSLESDSIMQEHEQRHPILNIHHFGEHVSYPNTLSHHGLSDTERQQYGHFEHQGVPLTTGVKAPPPGIGLSPTSSGVGHSTSNWNSAPFGSRYGEVLTDNSTMSMGFMGEPGKPREDAQNFFGQFLKRAAQASVSIDGPGSIINMEKDPLPGIPFQDPAIMSVRMSPSVASPSSRGDVTIQPQLHNTTASKSTGHRLSVFERLRDKTDDSPITVSGTTGTIVDMSGSGKQEYGPSRLPRKYSSPNVPSNAEQECTAQTSLSLESRTDQYMTDSTEKDTITPDSHLVDNGVREIVNKDASLFVPILGTSGSKEKREDNMQSINFQETVDRTLQPGISVEREYENTLKVPQQSDQAITTPSGNGKKKKKSKSRPASPSEDSIEHKLNDHPALKQNDEQAMAKISASPLSESNPNQVNFTSTFRDNSSKKSSGSEALGSPSSVFTPSVGLNFNTPISSTVTTSKAFDGITFPPFNSPLSGSHFWTANFQQPSSSIPELEREIESARKEAAMLNVKLQAAIRKNQAFATGW